MAYPEAMESLNNIEYHLDRVKRFLPSIYVHGTDIKRYEEVLSRLGKTQIKVRELSFDIRRQIGRFQYQIKALEKAENRDNE